MSRLWVVDPGLNSAFSLWDLQTGKLDNVGRKEFKSKDRKQILQVVYKEACDIFKRHAKSGDELIVEDGYIGFSAHGAMTLHTIRAAWECAALAHGLVVRPRLHPKTWQAAIGVKRTAKREEVKEVVMFFVSKVFGEGLINEINQDQADAIAMGIVAVSSRE